jgi:hypothetical protein
MAYTAIILDPATKPRVRGLIERVEEHYLRDVHAMLRLPVPGSEIYAGCNFAIAQVLGAVVSGVSVTLYKHSGGKGERFKQMLVDYYPWSEEPLPVHDREQTAAMIYSLVRNPLTHDLGIDLETKHRTRSVTVKRLTTAHGTAGHTEGGVEALEIETRPTNLSPTVRVEADRVVLLVEAFYWGIRRMLQKFSADPARVATAERFLESLETA